MGNVYTFCLIKVTENGKDDFQILKEAVEDICLNCFNKYNLSINGNPSNQKYHVFYGKDSCKNKWGIGETKEISNEKGSGIEIKTLGMLLKQLGKAGKTSYPDFNIKIPLEEDGYPYGYGEIEWDYLYKKVQKVTANKKDSEVDLTLDLSRGRILEIRLSYSPKTSQKEKDKINYLMGNLEENGWSR